MYLDEAQPRFVLSAKRVGDSFFISQYESFPESINGVPEVSSCAVLRTCSEGYFKLFLNGCEACDKKADKYTCGSGHSFDNRQLLAEINHVRTKKQCKCKTKDDGHISSNIINSEDALNLCHHLLVRLGSPYIY